MRLRFAATLVSVGAVSGAGCAALIDFPDVPSLSSPSDAGTFDVRAADAPRDVKKDTSTRDSGESCAPGTERCIAGNTPTSETCTATGWGPPTPCPSGCDTASGACLEPPPPPPSPMPASCAATDAGPLDGIDDCGSSMSDSCCATLPVTAGTYFRTYAVSDAGAATAEGDPAEVSRFELDKYPVTVGRFLRYVGYLANGGAAPVAGSGTHTQLNGGNGLVADPGGGFETGWDSAWDVSLPTGPGALAMWTAQLAACPDATWGVGVDAGVSGTLPVNCVTWYEAYAFCIWDGGFLPSEAEWEYAAGGALQVPYPWGFTTPGPLDVASYAIVGCDYGGPGCGVGSVAPVGSAPSGVGPFGQLDLLGEVEEWTLDAYAGAYPVPCDDCAELPSMGALRVVRGAAWSSPLTAVTVRASQDPATTAAPLGLRCARSPGT